jgi:molybdopterin converting factor subunit 1
MHIQVKLFALIRERAGVSELSLDLPDGSTVAGAIERLSEQFPQTSEFLPRCAVAINREYASIETPLQENDELAIIPPVSGG